MKTAELIEGGVGPELAGVTEVGAVTGSVGVVELMVGVAGSVGVAEMVGVAEAESAADGVLNTWYTPLHLAISSCWLTWSCLSCPPWQRSGQTKPSLLEEVRPLVSVHSHLSSSSDLSLPGMESCPADPGTVQKPLIKTLTRTRFKVH